MYISRRSLKHFVESRKSELKDYSDHMSILEHMFFILDHADEVFRFSDIHEFQESNKEIFTKHYDHLNKSSIRIIVEIIGRKFEVRTMHYKKYKKLITED